MPGITEDMEIIHRRSQLIVARNTIARTAIADPSIIDAVQYSPNETSIIGLQVGATTLTLWFAGSSEPLIYLVNVVRDPSVEEQRRIDYGKLEKKLALLFPNSKVYLIPLSEKIIVKGQARDAEEAAKILSIIRGEVINRYGDRDFNGGQPNLLNGAGYGRNFRDAANQLGAESSLIVNMLDVPGEHQVMLHVRIAELNRSQLRRMGVDFNVLINGGRQAIAASIGGVPSTLTGIFENGEVSVLLNWLASNGTAKLLSEPTLTVLSGHNASFLAGGEFPVPTIVGVGGAQGTSTTFRGFGTSLNVTPTVLDKDLVRMRIVPEFSELNQGNSAGGIPGLNSRRVQTTVELREGQTIAIAGLFSHQSRTDVTRIPLLGEIPKIGPLIFNSKRATQDETELLILVTPEIVRAMEPDEVPPVPGFYTTHPNDYELYKLGMTEGVPNQGVYQLAPYGSGSGTGMEVGYQNYTPVPADAQYAPQPTNAFGGGYSTQRPRGEQVPPNGFPPRIPPATPNQNPNQMPNQSPNLIRHWQQLPPPPAAPSPSSGGHSSGSYGPETLRTPGGYPAARSAQRVPQQQQYWAADPRVVPAGYDQPVPQTASRPIRRYPVNSTTYATGSMQPNR